MASYHLHTKIIGRSAGRSAVACAAYRSGEQLEDERYGKTHDYTNRDEVVHSEILTPENTPDWMKDRGQLWNAIERISKQHNSQLAKEYELALPRELSPSQRVELVRRYVQDRFVSKGMIADIAIHKPHKEIENDNHHAHIMLTMREITAEGFGRTFNYKNKDKWNDRKLSLTDERKEWADYQNREFERLGLDVRVDHRSNEARGIDRDPEQHLGPKATAMKRRGANSRIVSENNKIDAINDKRVRQHLQALHELARLDEEQQKFSAWAHRKEAELAEKQYNTRAALLDQQMDEIRENDARLRTFYQPHLKHVEAEVRRLTALQTDSSFRGRIRRLWKGQQDKRDLANFERTVAATYQRMEEGRAALRKRHAADLAALEEIQQARREGQLSGIDKKRAQKDREFAQRHERAESTISDTADAISNDNRFSLDEIKRNREKWREGRRPVDLSKSKLRKSRADPQKPQQSDQARDKAKAGRTEKRRGKLLRLENRADFNHRKAVLRRRRSIDVARAHAEKERQQRVYEAQQFEKSQAADKLTAKKIEVAQSKFAERKNELRQANQNEKPVRSIKERSAALNPPKATPLSQESRPVRSIAERSKSLQNRPAAPQQTFTQNAAPKIPAPKPEPPKPIPTNHDVGPKIKR